MVNTSTSESKDAISFRDFYFKLTNRVLVYSADIGQVIPSSTRYSIVRHSRNLLEDLLGALLHGDDGGLARLRGGCRGSPMREGAR